MKIGTILVNILIGGSLCNIPPDTNIQSPVFGYIRKYGIPAARRLQEIENDYLNTETRVVGGVPSVLRQQPYQAGLIISIVNTTDRGLCGGSLITPSTVLTAAHCWYDGEHQAWLFEAVLGSVLLFSGGIRFNTSAVSVHPQWEPLLIRNDIAVVYLPDYVQISDESASKNQILYQASVSVIQNRLCGISYPLIIQSTHICTSSLRGASPCRGDSGGPLVVSSNGRDILIGVTSFGSAFGCESLFPAVYTRVTSYLKFIYQHIPDQNML